MMTATYSPEDNKLRLYADARLSRDLYERVKAAGFTWAAKQGLFVAPAWTPEREDLLTELCGEVGDEDTSLAERAGDRADRFDGYRDRRAGDAERARAAVAAVADAIPLGQPILVGHHSERHARRDAERIEREMRKAVRLWQTAQYWEDRAAGAVRHAKYKERPAVRARRIKTIEADRRKAERERDTAIRFLKAWRAAGLTHALAVRIANHDHVSRSFPLAEFPRQLPASQYEGAMSLWSALTEGVMTAAQARRIAVRCHARTIRRARRWVAHCENRLTYERAVLAAAGGIPADRVTPEKGGAVRCWASPGHGRGWSIVQKVNKVSVTVLDNWGNGGKDFTRTIPFDKLAAVMSAAEVAAKRAAGLLVPVEPAGFYLADEPVLAAKSRPAADGQAETFERMAEALRAGVKVVSAPQLFPTPLELAARVVELADIRPGMTVLEPSAGTGNLVRAVLAAAPCATVYAVEINPTLHAGLSALVAGGRCGDFLAMNGELGPFDRVVMNPPFERGADIRHVEHARGKLKPGGRLVAIVADGPRQRDSLKSLATVWYSLPPGSFAEEGTNVNAAILVIDA
jgi:hypothetical protein